MSKKRSKVTKLGEQAIITWWEKQLKAGEHAKAEFTKMAKLVDSNLQGPHKKFFGRDDVQTFLKTTGVTNVSVNLAFQLRGWFAPALHQRNPVRTVSVRSRDSVQNAAAKVMEAYLNYTPGETGLAEESRKVLDEALLAGRGATYTGEHETTDLISSWFVSIDDILIDPDAKTPDDAYWIGRRELLPDWKVEELYGARAKGIKPTHKGDTANDPDRDHGTYEYADGEKSDGPTDGSQEMCEIWHIYSKLGLGAKGKNFPPSFKHIDTHDFRLIVISPGHDRMLNDPRSNKESSWEVPLYLDDAWPITFLDLSPTRNQLWGTSIMGSALTHQEAIDLLATIRLELSKVGARQIIFVKASLSADQKKELKEGGLFTVIEVGITDALQSDLKSIVEKWSPGQNLSEILRAIDEHIAWHEGQFAQVTGLLPILKGGGFEVQARSATEADIKDRNARSRVQDMAERAEDHQSSVARNEGIMLRIDFGNRIKQLEQVVDIDLGWLVSFSDFGVEYLRRSPPKSRRQEQENRKLRSEGVPVKPASLEEIFPPASHYYVDQEEAEAVAAELQQMVGQSMGFEIQARAVTVEDVWLDTQGMEIKQIMREISYRIESGSTKRPDHNKKIQLAEMVTERVAPLAMQIFQIDPAAAIGTVNKNMELNYGAFQTPEDERVYLPIPQPPQQPQQGGEQGAPPQQAAAGGEQQMNMLQGGAA